MATKIMLEAFFSTTRFHPGGSGMRIVYCTKGAQGPFCLRTVSPVSNGLFCPCSQEPDFLSKELFINSLAQWPLPKVPLDGSFDWEKGGRGQARHSLVDGGWDCTSFPDAGRQVCPDRGHTHNRALAGLSGPVMPPLVP